MKRVGLLMMIGLILAACAPAASKPAAPPASAPTVGAPTNAPAVAQPATEVVPAEAASAAPTVVPTRKPVKSELEATDPGTVQLAAGKPQFVEFFAFW
ncbi:MAG: hypothetical protein KA765_15440 [Thermoflexales bacterium]|nr:hypothetical protein [Thermoflexales bacterium]